MKRQRDLAGRLRDLRKLTDDGFLRETLTLPLNAARLKARQILDEYPAGRLYDDSRKLAPASRRANRVHDAAIADGGLVKPPCAACAPASSS
jgi:hypothetical protein